jgi:hypothetical protein
VRVGVRYYIGKFLDESGSTEGLIEYQLRCLSIALRPSSEGSNDELFELLFCLYLSVLADFGVLRLHCWVDLTIIMQIKSYHSLFHKEKINRYFYK